MKNYVFNKQDVFERDVRPLLDALVSKCAEENIPLFCTAAVANGASDQEYEKGTLYVQDGVMCGSKQIGLIDDKITKCMLVARGFDVRPESEEIEILFQPAEDEPFLLEDDISM